MPALLRIRRRYRTDWFRVLVDLDRRGLSNQGVADVLDVPLATLRGWKAGSEPNHYDGDRLLELWQEQIGLPLKERPRTWD